MELYFKVKAQDDLEAKRIARNMAVETLRNKGMIGRWFEVQNVEWIQRGLFGDGVLAKVHVYVKDKKIMKDNQYKKIKAFLAQEFKDVKAMLKKKNFKDDKIDDADINDSLSEKAKQLISKAVSEARFDYKTAMDLAVADLKAEKEWAWTNHNEVSQMVQRLIKNRMDF